MREVLHFGRHLARLRLQIGWRAQLTRPARRRVPVARMVLFGLVGLSGVAVNTAALWLLHLHVLQLHYLVARRAGHPGLDRCGTSS